MSKIAPMGVVVFSVDLATGAAQTSLVQHRHLFELAKALVALFERYDMPATWALSEPALWPRWQVGPRNRCGHEIALLGDATWFGSAAADHESTERELRRRVVAARQANVCVTSLVVHRTELPKQFDLPRHGLTAVRGGEIRRPAASNPMQAKNFGLWLESPDVILPGRANRWFPGGPFRLARRAVRRAVIEAGAAHLAIDASQLLAGRRGLSRLEDVVRRVDRWRRQSRIAVRTLAASAAEHARTIRSTPARSILRSAA